MNNEREGFVKYHCGLFNWVLLYTVVFFALFLAGYVIPEQLSRWLYCIGVLAATAHLFIVSRRDTRALPLDDKAVVLKLLGSSCPDEEGRHRQP